MERTIGITKKSVVKENAMFCPADRGDAANHKRTDSGRSDTDRNFLRKRCRQNKGSKEINGKKQKLTKYTDRSVSNGSSSNDDRDKKTDNEKD